MANLKTKPFCLPKGALTFLAGLEKNNNKQWFDANRESYQKNLLEPLKTLVEALGSVFLRKLPELQFSPKVNGSIFRINRDTRFSKDKRPYKTNAGVYLWVGQGKKLACPGIYFHLEAKKVMLGSGIYMFEPEALSIYRRHVAAKGATIAKAITKAEKVGFALEGKKLKRVPSGFPADHKYSELLKMKGLHVTKTFPASKVIKGDLTEWLAKEYTPTLDLIRVIERAIF